MAFKNLKVQGLFPKESSSVYSADGKKCVALKNSKIGDGRCDTKYHDKFRWGHQGCWIEGLKTKQDKDIKSKSRVTKTISMKKIEKKNQIAERR